MSSTSSSEQVITQLESILDARDKQYARAMVTELGIENADDLSEVDDKVLEEELCLKFIPRKRIMRCLEAYLTKKRPRDEQDSDHDEDSRPRKKNNRFSNEDNVGGGNDVLSRIMRGNSTKHSAAYRLIKYVVLCSQSLVQ